MKQDTRTTGKVRSKRGGARSHVDSSSFPISLPPALKHALLLGAVIVFTFIAYSNSLHVPFLVDNDPIILKDARIRTATADHVHRIFTEQYWPTGLASLYRPFTTLTFMFNYAVLGNGADPAGYHWFNFLLHAINMVLVYALGLALFARIPFALLLTAIWGLHPVHTECVTNIVGRADMLGAFGVLAALFCHRHALSSSGGRRAAWLLMIVLAVTTGIFSKESAIVAIAAIAIYDLALERDRSWSVRLPSYVAVVAPCAIFLYIRAQMLANAPDVAFPFGDNPLLGANFWTARMTAVKVIGKYLGLTVWPANLSWDYSYNEIPLFGWRLTSGEDAKAILALIVCAALAFVALHSWRRNPPIFFAVAFFFATLSPASNLVILIGSIMGERFLYLPSIGLVALAVAAIIALSRRFPTGKPEVRYAAASALAVVLLALAVRTSVRNDDWLDPGRFWQRSLESAPNSYKTNLSSAGNRLLTTQNDWDRSLREMGHAIEILDPLPDLQNVGLPYREAGRLYRTFGERFASAKAAGNSTPAAGAEYWYRRSLTVLLRAERIELAQDEANRAYNARRGRPGLSFVPSALYLQLGRTYMRLSESRRALEALEHGRAIEADPDLLEDLSAAYKAVGEWRKAVLALVEAIAVDSTRGKLISQLLELYAVSDPHGCAVTREGETLNLNLECPLVHSDICSASRNVARTYTRTGQLFEASAIRHTAVRDLGCAPELVN